MKKIYKYLFVFLGSLLIFPLISNAQCSYERQAELSKIAANVQFNYTYDVINGLPKFNVFITNLTNDIYIKDNSMNIFDGTGEKVAQYENGTSVSYDIYSKDSACKDEKILTKYINLPTYNSYSTTAQCNDNSDFEYCQTWSSTGLKAADFEQKYHQYKQQLTQKQEDNEQSLIDKIKGFINQNLPSVIVCLFAILMIIILTIKNKKNKRC